MAQATFTFSSSARAKREEHPVLPASVSGEAMSEDKAAAPAAEAAKPSAGRALLQGFRNFTSRHQRTNYSMLLFRTAHRDLCVPNANEDYIAPLFRDYLMPVRSLINRTFGPTMVKVFKSGVEDGEYGVPGVCNFVDARTKWLDGALKQALDEGFAQVVCIAAGYDTRAYRFYRRGVIFYEVDLPEASKKKQQMVKAVLPPPEQLPRPTYVGANLAEVALAQALEGSGFDPVKKTFFTCEGLIYYLPAEAVAKLFASVAELAAPGSRLLFDFLRSDALDGSAKFPGYDNCAQVCALKGEPFISALDQQADALAAYLAPLGLELGRVWSAREMVEKQLPHETWDDALPPIMACYGYAEAVKPAAEAGAE